MAERSLTMAGIPISTNRPVARSVSVNEAEPGSKSSMKPGYTQHDENHFADAQPPGAAEVVRAVLSDNGGLMANQPLDAGAKFDKLVISPLAFFRGTVGFFDRALKGLDGGQPRIVINGDVHPLNFGVVEAIDGRLLFGLNDVDEASRGPFSWDLRRGAASFALAARQLGFSLGQQDDVTRAFLEGYRDALKAVERGKRKPTARLTAKSAPPVVAKILERASGASRAQFLLSRVDGERRRFLSTDEIVPLGADRVPEFQEALRDFRLPDGTKPEVLDVALKLDSGTGSMGLQRFYVLVEGPLRTPGDLRILEVKYEGPSAAAAIGGVDVGSPGERVAAAYQTQAPQGAVAYGTVSLDQHCFIVRERSPFKAAVALDTLSVAQLLEYAQACGQVLAEAHVRGADAVGVNPALLLEALGKPFLKELRQFGLEQAGRIEKAHADFAAAFARDRFGLP